MPHSKWFLEQTTAHEGAFHSLSEIIYSGHSPYQQIEIIKTGSYGKCLVLDGKIQSSEADEFIYHEALVHPSLVLSDSPRRVLIAGGGEGATAREVAKHQDVKEIIICDLDREVVNASKKYLPEWHRGVFEDRRVKVVFEDARENIRNARNVDVMIIDLPEPASGGPALMLYTREFYTLVSEALSEDGIMVTQAASSAVHSIAVFAAITNTLKQVFPVVRPYVVNVPSFFTPWGFVLASRGKDPLRLNAESMTRKIGPFERELRFYDHEAHTGIFSLPKFARKAFEREDLIITDSSPLSFY
ncbi:MAG TPA: polyamine aminopropyltransferase [Dissulfurispiraceae bacterium]|nr:polyamine aminopropyltransferase [Dissulfurispiraceae bacterium]